MRTNRWIVLLVGLLACGLLAAGCGDDEESTSDAPAATEEAATDSEATTEDSESTEETSDSSEVDVEAFLSECQDAAAGTPAEATADQVCQQAADALEECAGAANDDQTIAACQDAADAAVKQLQAAG